MWTAVSGMHLFLFGCVRERWNEEDGGYIGWKLFMVCQCICIRKCVYERGEAQIGKQLMDMMPDGAGEGLLSVGWLLNVPATC